MSGTLHLTFTIVYHLSIVKVYLNPHVSFGGLMTNN
jgi:hypothetical protein